MAIYSLHHSPIGKSTQAQPYTAAAHINYITRRRAMSLMQKARLPGQNPREVAEYLKECEDKDRKNARVIDKVMLALPKELNQVERVKLVREFAEHVTQGRAPWLAAFHDKGKDARNPHCHLVLRDRDPKTNKRVIGTSEKGSTEQLRESWELFANQALERAGRSERIDRRTLAEQGIEREPTIHEGPQSQAMDKRGVQPRSRQRRVRNAPGARRPERNVDYRRIDNGKSRPQVNRMRRAAAAQENERDYWAAIDQDKRRRELQELALIHNPNSVKPIASLAVAPAQKAQKSKVDLPAHYFPVKTSTRMPGGTASRDVSNSALKPSAKNVARTKPKDKLADVHRPRPHSFGGGIKRDFAYGHKPSVNQSPVTEKGYAMSNDEELRNRKARNLHEAKHSADQARGRYDDLMGRSYLDPVNAEKKMEKYRAKRGDQRLYDKLADNSRKTGFGRRPGSIASRDGYTEGAPERRQDSQIARQYLGDATKKNHLAQERLRAAQQTAKDIPSAGLAIPASASPSKPKKENTRDQRALSRMREERKNERERER